jgi:hypothetical protein
MDNVRTLNSVMRTMILLVILAAIGYGGYQAYRRIIVPGLGADTTKAELEDSLRRIADLEKSLEAKTQEISKLQAALKLLKVDRRLAQVKILDKGIDPADGRPYLNVEFVEVDERGQPIAQPRTFRLAGDKLYVDCWLVKFQDQYVENADALRGTTMCIFKGIFGNLDGPEGSFPLDQGQRLEATAYGQGGEVSQFEQQIWSDFWSVANSADKQRELGIRAAHGQVNYVLVEAGMVYQVDLRASDGATIDVLESPTAQQPSQPAS